MDGCGGQHTGWRCYAEAGADATGPSAKVCPLLLNAVLDSLNPPKAVWSDLIKDCVQLESALTEDECTAFGLSWDIGRGACVAKCPPGTFSNLKNGRCIPISGEGVCSRGTAWDGTSNMCVVLDGDCIGCSAQTKRNSTYCGDDTVYDEMVRQCVASSSAGTLSVGSIDMPVWAIAAAGGLFVLSLAFFIVGCCCRCGHCGDGGDGSSDAEGYRKYLPEAYSNPAWRASYAAHA